MKELSCWRGDEARTKHRGIIGSFLKMFKACFRPGRDGAVLARSRFAGCTRQIGIEIVEDHVGEDFAGLRVISVVSSLLCHSDPSWGGSGK
jgi:hypothetical protein